ncbi:tetratricopeptide repeat protein [Trinickia sp.]|uniref:tetratricopeptide repeat protein n=1 Tax=Trinickia sp. TaxID=2571163 RepID=UPI003F7F9DE3
MAPIPSVVTGRQLDQFLDRIESDLEENDRGETDDLLTRLRAQPLRAHSIEAIARLHALWMRAGDTAAARTVLDADGASVLASAAPDARPDIRMSLALYRLQVGTFLKEDDAIAHALVEMRNVIAQEPGLHADRYRRWGGLDSIEHHHPAHALAAIELRHALCAAIPERAALRAVDEADRQRRRAWALARTGANADAVAAADIALAALAGAASDQTVNALDWLQLGDSLIEIAPHGFPIIERAVAALTSSWPLARRREFEIRLARLAARAAYARDGVAAALAACELARHSLSSDGTDDFIEYELRWLIEAGQLDDAGRRAFFHLYECEEQTWAPMSRIINERLADDSDTSVWWPLCVMLACDTARLLERLIATGQAGGANLKLRSPTHGELFAEFGETHGDALHEAVHAAARALAQRRAPGHPWIACVSALHDARAGLDDPAARADRLLTAIEQGAMNDDRSHYALFVARQQSLGLAAAIRFPLPALASGRAFYRYAAGLDEDDDAFLEGVPAPSRADVRVELQRFKIAAYEQGLARMERFLETGRGHPYDGCAQLYSMLCNNLGIRYTHDGRHSEAIELHRRGIDASPFADHYASLMSALRTSGEHAEAVDTAEQLWHFSIEHGFGDYSPNWFVRNVVRSLSKLEREDEILIWLERLVTWQRKKERVDEARLPLEALGARLIVALELAARRPNEATSLWESLRTQLEASNDPWIVWNAASTLYDLQRYPEARAWYERVLSMNAARPEHERIDTQNIETLLASYPDETVAQMQGESARKRRWRFWR